MNFDEKELNPPPKLYRVPVWAKYCFFTISLLLIGVYIAQAIAKRRLQNNFIITHYINPKKSPIESLPNILAFDMKSDGIVNIKPSNKWMLLHIWATWCPPCQEEMPKLEWLQKNLGQELNIVAISVDENKEAIKNFININQPSFSMLWDHEKRVANQLFLNKYPETFLIDKKGYIHLQLSGPKD